MGGGGNLLWLSEPGSRQGLEALAGSLGLGFGPGQIIDPTTPLFGVDQTTFPIVSRYLSHPVTTEFDLNTLYPEAVALTVEPHEHWLTSKLMTTSAKAWSETGSPARGSSVR